MRFRRAYKNHVEQYDNYSDEKVEYSSEMKAIEDIVIPEGAIMKFSESSPDVPGASESSRRWWNPWRKQSLPAPRVRGAVDSWHVSSVFE